jgi:hypothetical protein
MLANGAFACVLAIVAAGLFAVVVLALDGRDLRAMLSRRYADG